LALPAGSTFIRYQKIPDKLALHISTWDRAFYFWTASSKPAVQVPQLNSRAFQIRAEDSVNAATDRRRVCRVTRSGKNQRCRNLARATGLFHIRVDAVEDALKDFDVTHHG
jgi:hypothetical protein